ncbi:uncharacterized protein LOC131658196 [Vicia villosa]|uniref:uncharacterized protein LOC131658196 n=1 Tax=Vicia villosa TaxID=3911 RepID=UPI00273BDECA|nr:uncharacterized protein LOC131658196 [Vicia villosa]
MSATSEGSVHGETILRNQQKGYQNDTLNPYFMHPNENPALVLVTPLLSSNNYHSWSRSMTMALRSKNKLHFINGALPRPSDLDFNSIAWDRCNTMIMSWIKNSVEHEIAQSILWIENAADMWIELKERFYHGDVFRISDLQEEICTLKQGDTSISSYYTKLKILWQELDNFRPIPTCDCDPTCCAITKIRTYRDSDQVIRFLKGLNDQYAAIRSQIMLMDPLPNICKVYSLLVQQERQSCIPLDEPKVLATPNTNRDPQSRSNSRGRGSFRGGRSLGGRGRGNRVCTHCGMTNHTVDTCFKKHGYPPNWKPDGAVNNYTTAHDKSDTHSSDDSEANAQVNSGLAFTPEQHKALLALLQDASNLQSHSINHLTSQTNPSSGIICAIPNSFHPETFVLDTGATDHVCFTQNYFQCLKQIKPITIKLPNGSLVTTKFSGTIKFTDSFYITDVLYMPEFSFNLISVPKLTKTLNCQLMFTDVNCVIQDLSSKMMIGTAELHGGLYLLKSPSVSLYPNPPNHFVNSSVHIPVNSSSNCSLWHLRLGHTSFSKLVELNKNFPFIKPINSNLPCDVCFYAKQKRLPSLIALIYHRLFLI